MPVTLNVLGSGERLTLSPRLIVAGYTARDEAAVRAHIAELADIGVPPPASVPAFYDLDSGLLTTEPVVEVGSPATSGEVEPVLIRHAGRFYLGVGSDHTDRELERRDIAESKAACPKPLGDTVTALGTDLSRVDWDSASLMAIVDDQVYQEGSAATLRDPADLLARMSAELGELAGDLVVFCGTLSLIGGEFVYGRRWRVQLALPGDTILTHAYEIIQRSN